MENTEKRWGRAYNIKVPASRDYNTVYVAVVVLSALCCNSESFCVAVIWDRLSCNVARPTSLLCGVSWGIAASTCVQSFWIKTSELQWQWLDVVLHTCRSEHFAQQFPEISRQLLSCCIHLYTDSIGKQIYWVTCFELLTTMFLREFLFKITK
jgi:hypothetical protein